MKPQNPIQMAVIGAAHGIRGELRVKTFTGDPLAIGDYGPLYAKDGRAFEVQDVRPAGDVVVVRFKGVGDRTAAERLTGTELFVDRSVLPPEEEDEFYHADLVGLAVPEVNVAGGFIRVDAVAAGLVEDPDGDGLPEGHPDSFDPKKRPRGPREAGGNR